MGVGRVLMLALGAAAAAVALGGCGWPKDPRGTGDRVAAGHVLRVGVSEAPPLLVFQGERVAGPEAEVVRETAARLGARVEWTRGPESRLMAKLGTGDLDLVAAGLTADSPWTKEMGRPKPWARVAGEDHLILTPPGENGWILTLDRLWQGRRSAYEAQLAGVSAMAAASDGSARGSSAPSGGSGR